MLNLNAVPAGEQREFDLIPAGAIVRAIMSIKPGDISLPEYGPGNYFKAARETRAKWMELEFTVVGGPYDRRKFWDKIFVDGDKIGASGMPEAKEIGLRTLKALIDSANGLDPADMSPQAQQARNVPGVAALNGVEICAKVGIKKGTNGYRDTNRLTVAMTPKDNGYLPRDGSQYTQHVAAHSAPQQQTYAPQPMQQPQMMTSGAVPAWAKR